jgi:hypothetical protein
MKNLLRILVCCGAPLVVAHASPFYDSIDSANSYTFYISPESDASFSTPSGGTFALTNVLLDVYMAPTDTALNGFDVYLYSDNNTSPGTQLALLATYTDAQILALEGGATGYDATHDVPAVANISVSGVPLAANTRYWIDMVAVGSGTNSEYGWTLDTTGTGVGSEYLAFPPGPDDVVSTADAQGTIQMEVEGIATPEPGTFMLGAASLALLALKRRRA